MAFALLPLLGSATAEAQCGPSTQEFVSASTRLSRVGANMDSPVDVGHPAEAMQAFTYDFPNYANLGVTADVAADNGFLDATTFAGGFTLTDFGSQYVSAIAYSAVYDCLTVAGASGGGRFHLPFHLNASSGSNWVLNGGAPAYPPGATPASSAFDYLCSVFDYSGVTPVAVACDDFVERWSTDVTIDEDREFIFTFNFDQPFSVQLNSTLTSALGYLGGSATGQLTGSSSGAVQVVFAPAYVTTLADVPVPGAVFSSAAGHDYANPVPEPGAALSRTAALFALLASARRRAPSPGRRGR